MTNSVPSAKSDQSASRLPYRRPGDNTITFPRLLWLFVIGSLAGVPIEGVWCLLDHGRWETHVVSVWGHFCIIYGFGLVFYYIFTILLGRYSLVVQFFLFALIGSVVEILCAAVLEFGLQMYAWDYTSMAFNFRGYITPLMTLIWGALGMVFRFSMRGINFMFYKLNTRFFRILTVAMAVFLAVDFTVTGISIWRWSQRHRGIAPQNKLMAYIDEQYPDEWMQKRFIEWKFISDREKNKQD